jgi:hypothetical protein
MQTRTRAQSIGITSLALLLANVPSATIQAAPHLVLWDTQTKLGGSPDLKDRTGWKEVPRDLFKLETDPAKASSDPGYYGRAYEFKGDPVVENNKLTAVFSSDSGHVILYSKGAPATPFAEITPLSTAKLPAHCEILRNASDTVLLDVTFQGDTAGQKSAMFTFGKDEIVEIKPATPLAFTIAAPLEYGILPGFIGDDLIYGPELLSTAAEDGKTKSLAIPSENIFLGLLGGEDRELVLTWPKADQSLKLNLAQEKEGKRAIESLEVNSQAQPFYIGLVTAPGLWHREQLTSSHLEQDMPIQWKPPFPARWQTQLTEAGVKNTFPFRQTKGTVWRGVPGSYIYPVWFDGETPMFHLSKKIPPKGEALIYCLEGQDTPESIHTPADILNATLGRQLAASVIDETGRKLRTHHRGVSGVHRACTCGYTEAIQAVFESGEETGRKEFIEKSIGDMVYFVQKHLERIDEYRHFADDTGKFLQSKQNSGPELKELVENLQNIVQQIPQEYAVQLENMKSLDYAAELTHKTMALTEKHDPKNLAAYMDLLKAWRGMGGAQVYVVAQCHMITRKLFQEAGYACATEPKALALAAEVRARCKQVLRNPDGYEIWPNY